MYKRIFATMEPSYKFRPHISREVTFEQAKTQLSPPATEYVIEGPEHCKGEIDRLVRMFDCHQPLKVS